MNEPTTSTEPKLLTERQVSAMIGKSVIALQQQRHKYKGKGKCIPYKKIGRSVRYLESDVLAWLDNRTTPKKADIIIDVKPKRKSKKKIISALNLSKPQLGRLNKLISTADKAGDIKISTLIAARLISVRLGNVLNSLDIKTIDDLANANHAKIAVARHCGKKTTIEATKLLGIFFAHPRNWELTIDGMLDKDSPSPRKNDLAVVNKLVDPANLEVTVDSEEVKIVPVPLKWDEVSQEDGVLQEGMEQVVNDKNDRILEGVRRFDDEEKKSNMGLFALIKAYIRSRLPLRRMFNLPRGNYIGIDIQQIISICPVGCGSDDSFCKFTIEYKTGDKTAIEAGIEHQKEISILHEEIIKEWLK